MLHNGRIRRLEVKAAPPCDLPPVIEQRDGGIFYKGEKVTEEEIDDLVAGLKIKPGLPDLVEVDLREHEENADE